MIAIAGQGLHSAAYSTVRFSVRAGAVAFRVAGVETPIDELEVADTARSSAVLLRDGRRLATVEHLFAALGGLRIRSDIVIDVEGPEVPLVDGGAQRFAKELIALGPTRSRPRLRVAREATLAVGGSRYEFAISNETSVVVDVDFDHPKIERHARWDGDSSDFVARIAPARTFGFEHEVEELLARGLASHVSPESVIVLGRDRVLSAGAPYEADEPARHKLLDLVGDMYLHGGPCVGIVRASKPGHAATHEAMKQALAAGILVRD
ncbi:UDP-3-O-[3-hydroxymyristoyl] N-acetylglucosamine deacetylase [Labilithrix luteola]|uniref:UDP-3-O-acyl-N-acetylglucosamine deacetylase n=1 Tax=Labilithrix luteola TaxID=1391654 RepID=A0A0K1PK35_9BACT|nr:UDP-3-O-acyl-N-acetylglucosamine deacetylase [Labilithrix luteola]AKU93474.1 UDP-3-O-[3-hydroxymyristoyl] N-acetylglucosamine deacetylase [Labilithrix luteola]